MAWYRIEGSMPQHEKYAPLSDSAFRLAITAGAWCASMMTDGRLPKKMIAGLTRAPAGKKLDESVAELIEARIWDRIEGDDTAFNVHDFLDWNMSREQWQAKKAAGSAGGKAKAAKKQKQPPKQKASKRLAPASDLLEQTSSTCSSVPLADSDSDSDSDGEKRSEIPPTPPSGGKRKVGEKSQESICPNELTPNEATLAAAQELGVDWSKHFARMRDWSQSGGKKKADWQATLRNWMRNNPTEYKSQQLQQGLFVAKPRSIDAKSAGLPGY